MPKLWYDNRISEPQVRCRKYGVYIMGYIGLYLFLAALLRTIFKHFYERFQPNLQYSETELIYKNYIRIGYLSDENIKYAVYNRKKIYRIPNRNGIYRTITEIEQDFCMKFHSFEDKNYKESTLEYGKEGISGNLNEAFKVDMQKLLNNYWNGITKKSKEEIGRDYERYVGYLYEQNGYKVSYQGIKKKMEDGGIDLICQKGNEIDIVQCKNWGKEKIIHEKHINQLYGACSV